MKVIIRNNAKDAALWVAHRIAGAIVAKAKVSEKPFVLGLPTGSTPLDVYAELVRMNKAGEVSFKNVITFNMDEYVGIPVDHPESYHSFMYRNLFDHIDIPRANIHILNGNAPDLAAECASYEEKIVAAGGFDLFFGGIGEDGHIAFNEPFSSLQSRTRVVTLTEDTIRVNSRFFGGEVVILALGPKKARAIGEAVEGPITHKNTVSALQNHPDGIIVVDEDAAGEFKLNSYKYFKAVEAAEAR